MTALAAFILGGFITPMTIGGLIGYYWARANVRKAVFEWLHDNWPDDYHDACNRAFEHDFEPESTELH